MQLLCGVLSVDEDHCHGALQLGVKADDEVNFLVICQLHFEVLDTFKLLGLFLDREVLIIADYFLCEVDNLICVRCRVEAVLWCDINFCELLLERSKTLMI